MLRSREPQRRSRQDVVPVAYWQGHLDRPRLDRFQSWSSDASGSSGSGLPVSLRRVSCDRLGDARTAGKIPALTGWRGRALDHGRLGARELAERSNAVVLKTTEPGRVPWVRIPHSRPAAASEALAPLQVDAGINRARRAPAPSSAAPSHETLDIKSLTLSERNTASSRNAAPKRDSFVSTAADVTCSCRAWASPGHPQPSTVDGWVGPCSYAVAVTTQCGRRFSEEFRQSRPS